MNEQFGLSVIVPVYNSASFLSECLDSILRQTFRDLEIICVDDGSTDGSPAILDHYARIDSRVRVLHRKNAGVSSARNAGLQVATMEIVTFVDSDDTIEPEMYAEMYKRLTEKNLDCVCCNYKIIDRNGSSIISSRFGEQMLGKAEIEIEIVQPILGFSGKNCNCLVSVCNKLFRTDILNSAKIRFNEKRTHGEDWQFCIEYYAAAQSVGFHDGSFYRYRHNAGSLVSRPRKDFFALSLEADDLFRKLFPTFDWSCLSIANKLNRLPFDAALHYRLNFHKKVASGLLEDIFRLSADCHYFSEIVAPNEKTALLAHSIESNDCAAFVRHLKRNTERDYLVCRAKNILKAVLNRKR